MPDMHGGVLQLLGASNLPLPLQSGRILNVVGSNSAVSFVMSILFYSYKLSNIIHSHIIVSYYGISIPFVSAFPYERCRYNPLHSTHP